MPELPEVQTTVLGLKQIQLPILGALFVNIWADAKKLVKKPDFEKFKKEIKGKKIKDI